MRESVLEHRDVNIQGDQLLAANINPRELGSRQLVADVCVENALPFLLSKGVQALPKCLLRGDAAARKPAEEKVGTELLNVGIAAVAGGHETNGAADNGGCRVTGIGCRRQLGIPILHAGISVKQSFDKG